VKRNCSKVKTKINFYAESKGFFYNQDGEKTTGGENNRTSFKNEPILKDLPAPLISHKSETYKNTKFKEINNPNWDQDSTSLSNNMQTKANSVKPIYLKKKNLKQFQDLKEEGKLTTI